MIISGILLLKFYILFKTWGILFLSDERIEGGHKERSARVLYSKEDGDGIGPLGRRRVEVVPIGRGGAVKSCVVPSFEFYAHVPPRMDGGK